MPVHSPLARGVLVRGRPLRVVRACTNTRPQSGVGSLNVPPWPCARLVRERLFMTRDAGHLFREMRPRSPRHPLLPVVPPGSPPRQSAFYTMIPCAFSQGRRHTLPLTRPLLPLPLLSSPSGAPLRPAPRSRTRWGHVHRTYVDAGRAVRLLLLRSPVTHPPPIPNDAESRLSPLVID
ncbi:hypothetical protein B0H11DRAFT_529778 [Mycena galericulata]|nr:hypothetical protein B0H11DRAFT_529778 [Mycena galericulata]